MCLCVFADMPLFRAGALPSELGNLINLTQFWLGQNQFQGELPSELGNLINLTYLSMSENQFVCELLCPVRNLAIWPYDRDATCVCAVTEEIKIALLAQIPGCFFNWAVDEYSYTPRELRRGRAV